MSGLQSKHFSPVSREGNPRRLKFKFPSGLGRADRRNRFIDTRRGISLVEVMVAMLVALIGVFGVFVLIPFAVRQVEIGMNEEAAQTLARNGMSHFEAQGLHDVSRWARPDTITAGPPFYTAIAADAVVDEFFCIDPWGMSYRLLPTDDPQTFAPQAFLSFPYFIPAVATPFPTIPRLTLFDRTGQVFTKALARRLFSGHDDLVTQAPLDDFSGPSQNFFANDGGRQYSGRLTWQMFVARDADIDEYARFYGAVSLDRVAETQDRLFDITRPNFPLATVTNLFGGGDFELTEVNGTQTVESTLIRRGLWMMLIAQSGAGTVEDIAFYRVLESDLTSAPGALPRIYNVTLQGSDLTVQIGSTVKAVLLPSVIAVYERTLKFEPSSDWNAN